MPYPYLTPTLPDLIVLQARAYRAQDIAAMQQQQPGEEAAAAAAVAGRGGNSSSSRMTSAVISLHRMAATGKIWNTTINFVGGAVSTSNGGDNRWIPLTEIYIDWWYHYTWQSTILTTSIWGRQSCYVYCDDDDGKDNDSLTTVDGNINVVTIIITTVLPPFGRLDNVTTILTSFRPKTHHNVC